MVFDIHILYVNTAIRKNENAAIWDEDGSGYVYTVCCCPPWKCLRNKNCSTQICLRCNETTKAMVAVVCVWCVT